MNQLVQKEIAEADAVTAANDAPFDIGDITTATICGTEDDTAKAKGSTDKLNEMDENQGEGGKQEQEEKDTALSDSARERVILPPALRNKDKENRDSRVLFTIPSENEENEDGNGNTEKPDEKSAPCTCPCHVAQQVFDDLVSLHSEMDDGPMMFSRQTSVQGKSLEDVRPLLDNVNAAMDPVYDKDNDKSVATMDKYVQVGQGLEDPGGRRRQISRTTSVSERSWRPPSLYTRTYSIYDRQRLMSSGEGRDRSRTVSSGEDFSQSAGPRLLQRGLSRQQSVFQAKCKEKEVKEKEKERDKDRINDNRLSVKDHEHFSVSIDDLNAATEQYFKDTEDNSALKTTLVTPTDEHYPVFADAGSNAGSNAKAGDVTINVEEV